MPKVSDWLHSLPGGVHTNNSAVLSRCCQQPFNLCTTESRIYYHNVGVKFNKTPKPFFIFPVIIFRYTELFERDFLNLRQAIHYVLCQTFPSNVMIYLCWILIYHPQYCIIQRRERILEAWQRLKETLKSGKFFPLSVDSFVTYFWFLEI